MQKHIVKSLFILLIVALAQFLPFAPSTVLRTPSLAESQVEQTERLFSACLVADAEFCLVKSNKPRIDSNSDAHNIFCTQQLQNCAASTISAFCTREIQTSRPNTCSLWLLFCALLI